MRIFHEKIKLLAGVAFFEFGNNNLLICFKQIDYLLLKFASTRARKDTVIYLYGKSKLLISNGKVNLDKINKQLCDTIVLTRH